MADADAGVMARPEERVCPTCCARVSGSSCAKHGVEELVWKCRFCCAPAVFFCWGSHHFCDRCHQIPGDMKEAAERGELPHCPAGPQRVQLEGGPADCPLGVAHPPTGTEHVLGCAACMRESEAGLMGGGL